MHLLHQHIDCTPPPDIASICYFVVLSVCQYVHLLPYLSLYFSLDVLSRSQKCSPSYQLATANNSENITGRVRLSYNPNQKKFGEKFPPRTAFITLHDNTVFSPSYHLFCLLSFPQPHRRVSKRRKSIAEVLSAMNTKAKGLYALLFRYVSLSKRIAFSYARLIDSCISYHDLALNDVETILYINYFKWVPTRVLYWSVVLPLCCDTMFGSVPKREGLFLPFSLLWDPNSSVWDQ